MQQVLNPGHYVGLPTIWVRLRKDALTYVKERIQDKIQSWRNRLLNNADKELLIKYVVTMLPTYVMIMFKLLATWCEEFNSMVAKL